MVVGIVEWISCNLLALARYPAIFVSKRIVLIMAVKVGLGIFVAQSDKIVVVDVNGESMHRVVGQRLLKLWRHEVIARARSCQNGKMDLEPK